MSALTEALVAAQAELPTAIGRDSQGYGYRYTSLDKLIAETRPILTKHGIAITQWPTYCERLDSDGKVALVPGLATMISHTSSETMTSHVQVGGKMSGSFGETLMQVMPLYLTEPRNMQSLGSAITYARRYAWAAALGIASEEDEEDTDAATLKADEDSIPF